MVPSHLHIFFRCNKKTAFAMVQLNSEVSLIRLRNFSSVTNKVLPCQDPVLDESYLCNPKNEDEIAKNIESRKGVGDVRKVIQLHKEFYGAKSPCKDSKHILVKEMLKIPNQTHPDVLKYGDIPHTVKTIGNKVSFNFKPKLFQIIAKSLNLLKNDVSNFTGHRSYFFTSHLADLESALIKFSLGKLLNKGFKLVSVPDILPRFVIESCGMETRGKRSQVYSLNEQCYGADNCLSGTSEMALAAYLMGKELSEAELPLRLAAVSRCYRAETSRTSDERGIYRVHQFTKVEMFGVSAPENSAELLEEFREFQEEHFASLGLHLRVLDMPAHELGAQAYRKYDVEAWLPGKEMWAELSSCSDCTDYQSRRLNIRYGNKFVHTVNGTACAVPRLVIALFETHQQSNGTVLIPQVLRPLMDNASVIKQGDLPTLQPIRRQTQKS